MTMEAEVRAERTSVLPRFFDLAYPNVERGEGVRLILTDGREILDACSGGAMVAALGHGVQEIVDAAADQAGRLAYLYFHQFTNEPQERLATRLIETAAPEMSRIRFTSGGSEANEMMLRLVRQYHVDRGEGKRWRVISPAQSYHGATMGALALSGRPTLRRPFDDYLSRHLHLAPSTWRFDPTGREALEELDRLVEEAGAETIAAFVCEPVSASALPGYSPPDEFWHGLAERRERYGFLVCFDEIVTGMGRTGSWFAYQQLPLVPDVVTAGKGLGAGYFPLAATLCTEQVYKALEGGSRELEHGHTWDGAPLSCAVGLAVLDYLLAHRLVERVRERGPSLRDELEAAVGGLDTVREVRGRGYLLGVELVDPRDGESFLPDEIDAAELVDQVAYEHGVLVTSSHVSPDRFAGDQTLLAPAYTSSDEELGEMIERFSAALVEVDSAIKRRLVHASPRGGER
jgi:adenosylmethionine-8-amino-7-oxononanoate aminotransferase